MEARSLHKLILIHLPFVSSLKNYKSYILNTLYNILSSLGLCEFKNFINEYAI